jgi:hypothetical protein
VRELVLVGYELKVHIPMAQVLPLGEEKSVTQVEVTRIPIYGDLYDQHS